MLHRVWYCLTIWVLLVAALPTTQDEKAVAVRDTLTHLVARKEGNLNELKTAKTKKPVTLIYARGTKPPPYDVPTPNMDDLGYRFFDQVATQKGAKNMLRQGVTYGATWTTFLGGGDDTGAKSMAALIRLAIKKNSSTRIVLGGYSQGAQLVYKALSQLSAAEVKKIRAVVLFGNPNGSKALPKIDKSRVKIFCHKDDNICAGEKWIPSKAHETYGADAPAAAVFVADKLFDV